MTLLKTFTLIFAICLISACSSRQVADSNQIYSQAQTSASQSEQSAEEVITHVLELISDMTQNGLSFYSPLHIQNAKDQLHQARQALTTPDEEQPNAPLIHALAAKSLMEKAETNATTIKANFKEILDNKLILEEIGVQQYDSDAYADILSDIEEVISIFESGKTKQALAEIDNIVNSMRSLEGRFLIDRYITPAKQNLQHALDNNAEDYAPQTCLNASRNIESAEQFVRNNNRNRIAIEEKSKEALAIVQHCAFVAQDAKKLINLLPNQAERHVLKLGGYFKAILNQPIDGSDLTPMLIEPAAKQAEQKVKHLNLENKKLSKQLQETQNELRTALNELEQESSTNTQEEADAFWLSPSSSDANASDEEEFETMDDG